MLKISILLAALPLFAADDAGAIVKRYLEADHANAEKAKEYTHVEERVWFDPGKNGELKQSRSETYDVIFLEGSTYSKLVARNGKPLSAKEQAKVEKAMKDTAEQRRKHWKAPEGGGVTNGHSHLDFGTDDELPLMFDTRVAGEEMVGGRKAWVVDATFRKDYTPANDHEKDVANFSKRYWIDQAENAKLRAVYTVVGDRVFLKPGSTVGIELQKLDGAWQPLKVVFTSRDKQSKVSQVEEIRYSNFKKFDVQSTITIDK